jgi:ring-1,2-phenylacetyl-CoA epoxidase subunit PaaC
MSASIAVERSPTVQYVLRLADTCLILSQRLAEWCGHAPVLEEDIALANMALDLLGQSRSLLTHAAQLEGRGHDEDQLAFLRDERDYLNATLAELPRGDFAFTVLRNAAFATWFQLLWQRLATSSDAQLAAIAGKALKESRYHQQHAADWVARLGDGSAESTRRMQDALQALWPYTNELFDADAIDAAAAARGLGPAWDTLRTPWREAFGAILDDAALSLPADSAFRSDGKRGRHSEHLGHMLTTMQYLQRAYPAGQW